MNRVVIVTGASRGLGLALSQCFLEGGDRVVGISKTKRHWPNAYQTVLNDSNFSLQLVDLTKETAVSHFFQTFKKKYPRFDILINNAGYAGRLERVEDLPTEELQKNLTQNLFSVFFMCKYAVPILAKQKSGLIMNVSSMAGVRAVPKLFAYSASKFGVLALSQCLAKENEGFKTITVCPGGMNTEMRASLFGKEDAERQQSPDYVASIMKQIADDEIKIESGGHIIIRHGKISGIFRAPEK